MSSRSEAFRDQARSDLAVFQALCSRASLPDGDLDKLPECHALHYLQMASGKAAKALLFLPGGPDVVTALASAQPPGRGWNLPRAHRAWQVIGVVEPHLLPTPLFPPDGSRGPEPTAAVRALLDEVTRLQPQVADDDAGLPDSGANVEYPWNPGGSSGGTAAWEAPAGHSFGMLGGYQGGTVAEAIRFLDSLLSML